MTRRYYHPDLPVDGGLVRLSEPEFQHAVRVMRVQVGDELELFDGKGRQAAAAICDITKRHLDCQAACPEAIDREPTRELHLAVALPKPDRARELIERLTELGVKSLAPLVTSRTQRPPSDKLLDRLRRGSVEACKQSGRNLLMQIQDPTSADDFFASCSEENARWIAHPDGHPIGELVHEALADVTAAIGPEGGWTADELEIAENSGFSRVCFGKRILRIETAATFLACRLLD